jgi:hypothetical protein
LVKKKYPVSSNKKRIASRNWKIDPTTGQRFKTVLTTTSKNRSISNSDIQEEVFSEKFKLIDFKKKIKKFTDLVNGKKTKSILNYSIDWLPKAIDFPNHVFAIFLNLNKIEKGAEDLLLNLKLIHGYFNNYIIISTRNRSFDFYSNVINFFFSFRSVMTNTKHKYQEPFLIRELTGFSANKTFLVFSNTKGRGILIKSLEDTKFAGGINTELDVLRIGKILGANVPRNAIVVHNTRSFLYKSFAKDADILVEDLSPVFASFSWVDKKLLDELREHDSENLGRIFVFDVVTGSWDRHSGNYLVTSILGYKSLQEIDFGLFKPDYYVSDTFVEEDDYRQDYPSKYPKLPGWGIFINSKVIKLMQTTDSRKFQQGIESAIKKLHSTLFIQKIQLENFASEKLVKRARGLFIFNSPVQTLFWLYISKIDNIYDKESLEDLLNRLSY